jgi:hypothetical protein
MFLYKEQMCAGRSMRIFKKSMSDVQSAHGNFSVET